MIVPNEEKVKFEQRLTLSCDADWVNAPERVLLHSGGFFLKIFFTNNVFILLIKLNFYF